MERLACIARALKVRPEVFEDHDITTVDQVIHALFNLEEQFGGVSMVYDTVHMVLAEGDMVLGVSEGTFAGAPTSYYDLWRVEDGKIAEHWDVMETIAERDTWANENGKF